ncbi:hypothetical protein J4408_01730 [Candidatus Pacearchaeota archaeon]|nr:hypothetical protein [Candidatus Pacearchaeota archaeon]
MIRKINKKGQVMIYVIIAIVLAGSLLLFFFLDREPRTTIDERESNPQSYIEKCVRKHVDDAVNIILPQGGFLEPTNFRLYNNIKVDYLCQNKGNYASCINQHPMLLNEIENDLIPYLNPKIEQCFSELRTELEKRNADIELTNQEIDLDFAFNRVYLKVNRKMTIRERGNTQIIDGFDVQIISPLYDLVNVAVEIANQEAKYCYFEYVGYQVLYPNFDIRKFAFSEGTKIYTIKDKYSDKEMNIAIRSCAIPPGI